MKKKTMSAILWAVAMTLYFMSLFAFDLVEWKWMCLAFIFMTGAYYVLSCNKVE